MKNLSLPAAGAAVAVLAVFSLSAGNSDIAWRDFFHDPAAADIVLISRWPRTAALMLCGVAMSVSGLIMQLLTQNRFIEPATAGTVPSASLGILLMGILWPAAPVVAKMTVAGVCALLGTGIFLLIISRLSLRSSLLIPLVGIMLGAVIGAVATFVAVRFEMLQSLVAWMSGDFSVVLRGRYEVLWAVGGLTVLTYVVADRFAVAGMGRDVAVNLGLDYRATLILGLAIVAAVNGVVTVVVGALPFLGLIVPNLISLVRGDNIRGNMPWICLTGGGIVLACDVFGRLIRYPYEIPVGSVLGVFGAVIFLFVLLKDRGDART